MKTVKEDGNRLGLLTTKEHNRRGVLNTLLQLFLQGYRN